MYNYYGMGFNPFWYYYHPLMMMPLYHPRRRWFRDSDVYDDRKDYGPYPFVIDIEDATDDNEFFRRTLWTGKYLQVTLMSLRPGEDIGLEAHFDVDQFIRIEEGSGMVEMGSEPNRLTYSMRVEGDDAIMVPAGTWHNIRNIGTRALKLYSIYAPPEHEPGTVHETKEIAMLMEEEHHS